MTFEELCQQAKDAIIDLDEDLAYDTLEEAMGDGVDLTGLLTQGYSAGMQELGDLFAEEEVFLPDLMYASEIMETVSSRMEKVMEDSVVSVEEKGVVIFATVEGDVHDIGKGICCSLLKANGFKVYDLGKDVSAEEIVHKAEEFGADIIGLSALLTTTMMVQGEVIELLKEKGIREKYKIMVGGAPVTPSWAEKIGADGYSSDASECVKLASSFVA